MSYIDLNSGFSVFDRDNMDRFQAAAYLRGTNAIAGDVLRSRDAAAGTAELTLADQEAGDAQAALSAHDYPAAFAKARSAYGHSRRAADLARVKVIADEATPWRLRAADGTAVSGLGESRWAVVDPTGTDPHRGAP